MGPARAHHSRKLGRCIHRLDHWCPVTHNVIGAKNHGHFVLMIFHGSIGCAYAFYMILCTVMRLVDGAETSGLGPNAPWPFRLEPALDIIGYQLILLFSGSVGGLFQLLLLMYCHVTLAAKNITISEDSREYLPEEHKSQRS